MKKNIEQLLLSEVNRMKEIMGIKVINEGVDPISLVKWLFGVSDEVAEKLSTNTESVLKQIVGGQGTYDDIAEYVAKQSGGLKGSIDVVSWVKSQPEIMDRLIKSSDEIINKAQQEVFSKLKLSNILDENSRLLVDDILTLKLNKNNSKSLPAEIDFVISELKKITKSKGQNKDIDELIKNLEDKKKLAQSYESINIKPDVSGSLLKSVTQIDTEVNDVLDEFISDEVLRNELKDGFSKLSANEKIKIKNVAESFSKDETEELFEKMKDVCQLKESLKIKSKLLNENFYGSTKFDKFCGGFSKTLKLLTGKENVLDATTTGTLKIGLIMVVFMVISGIVTAVSLGKDFIYNFFERWTDNIDGFKAFLKSDEGWGSDFGKTTNYRKENETYKVDHKETGETYSYYYDVQNNTFKN